MGYLPLICAGKISPINIHGIGPKPRENRTMNAHMDTSGINPIDDTLYSLAFKKKKPPINNVQIPITIIEPKRRIFLPNLSTISVEIYVAITDITPTIIVDTFGSIALPDSYKPQFI